MEIEARLKWENVKVWEVSHQAKLCVLVPKLPTREHSCLGHVQIFEQHSNNTPREMFKSWLLLYIYLILPFMSENKVVWTKISLVFIVSFVQQFPVFFSWYDWCYKYEMCNSFCKVVRHQQAYRSVNPHSCNELGWWVRQHISSIIDDEQIYSVLVPMLVTRAFQNLGSDFFFCWSQLAEKCMSSHFNFIIWKKKVWNKLYMSSPVSCLCEIKWIVHFPAMNLVNCSPV